MVLENGQGQKLRIEPIIDDSPWAKRFRGRETGWKKIAAGGSREFVIEEKTVNLKQHKKRVLKMKMSCKACHDVHGDTKK